MTNRESKKLINNALMLAKKAHAGQTDRGGTPYIKHVMQVYKLVGGANANPPELAIVALLHDVVEDTPVTVNYIRKEFGDTVADAVDAITKSKGEQYVSYITRVKKNKLARKVKYFDMLHNSDLSRLKGEPTEKDIQRKMKYQVYMKTLK